MEIYNSYVELYENLVLPLIKENPNWKRVDGAKTGGNREIFGKFIYENELWKIHSDTHIEKLTKAYELFIIGENPFVKTLTKDNKPTLEIKNDVGFKYIYIYKI